MAENENGEEKTEKATPKRLREAREKGQVAKSNDVVSVVFLIGGFFVIRLCSKLIYSEITSCIEYWMKTCGSGLENGTVNGDLIQNVIFKSIAKTVIISAAPIMICGLLFTVLSTGIQTKFLFSKETLKPNFGKLNPLKGIKNMFSVKALFELGKSLLKFIVIVVVLYMQLKDKLSDLVRLMQMEPIRGVTYIAQTIFDIVMQVCIIFVAIAALDFFFQKFSFEKDMRMTKQEVKDEYKNTEGDPKIKGKRKQKQYELHNLMMQNVKDADVVVRNPTHFAVALKYDPEAGEAPIVTAKGADRVALRIISEAEKHNVALVENRPLARALYQKAEAGRQIPFEFYKEVAEVLIFVYDLEKRAPPKPKDIKKTDNNKQKQNRNANKKTEAKV